jgi:hypothetical protein
MQFTNRQSVVRERLPAQQQDDERDEDHGRNNEERSICWDGWNDAMRLLAIKALDSSKRSRPCGFDGSELPVDNTGGFQTNNHCSQKTTDLTSPSHPIARSLRPKEQRKNKNANYTRIYQSSDMRVCATNVKGEPETWDFKYFIRMPTTQRGTRVQETHELFRFALVISFLNAGPSSGFSSSKAHRRSSDTLK